MNKIKLILATVVVLFILLGTLGVFMSKSSEMLSDTTSTDRVTAKEAMPLEMTEPQPRTTEQPVTILDVSEKDIRYSIEESQRTTELFQPKMPSLSIKDQGRLDDSVKQIMETKVALSKFENFDIPLQEAGRTLKISSAKLPQSGFITVWRSSGVGLLGSSPRLNTGTHHDIVIPLSEYIDGIELTILVYTDDGDGKLNTNNDKVQDDGIASANFKTHRDLRSVYYAPMIMSSSASVIVSGEQSSGNKMNPPQQVNLTRSYDVSESPVKKHFLVIHKDADGLPGRVLGVSQSFVNRMDTWGGQGVFDLTEKVHDEMLFFIAYEDNGDGRFSLEDDKPVRGQNNAIVLVRFRVAPEFE